MAGIEVDIFKAKVSAIVITLDTYMHVLADPQQSAAVRTETIYITHRSCHTIDTQKELTSS
jgi:hypothetical protein